MFWLVSVSDPYSLNPDPAKNLNPDPDPSYFLTLPVSEIGFFITSYLQDFLNKRSQLKNRML